MKDLLPVVLAERELQQRQAAAPLSPERLRYLLYTSTGDWKYTDHEVARYLLDLAKRGDFHDH